MAESKGGLGSDPLFLGLTRPVMFFGVHYLMFVLNMGVHLLLFINHIYPKQFMMLPSVAIVHGLLYLVCLREPRTIELIFARYGKCAKCKNRTYHKHTNSYDLF